MTDKEAAIDFAEYVIYLYNRVQALEHLAKQYQMDCEIMRDQSWEEHLKEIQKSSYYAAVAQKLSDDSLHALNAAEDAQTRIMVLAKTFGRIPPNK